MGGCVALGRRLHSRAAALLCADCLTKVCKVEGVWWGCFPDGLGFWGGAVFQPAVLAFLQKPPDARLKTDISDLQLPRDISSHAQLDKYTKEHQSGKVRQDFCPGPLRSTVCGFGSHQAAKGFDALQLILGRVAGVVAPPEASMNEGMV